MPTPEQLEALAHDVERASVIEFHSGDREPGARLSEHGKQEIAWALRFAAQRGADIDAATGSADDQGHYHGAPQTGGDAGERVLAWGREMQEVCGIYHASHVGRFEAALRSSHREGAEARRIGIEAIGFAHQWIAGLPVTPSFEDKRAAQASLEEAREQLRALPIPGKTE